MEDAVDHLVEMLRAAGDPTRLRLLLLLRRAELTVSELVEILGQSQPRVSRHLKLLTDAQLVERFKEGSWVFYRPVDRGAGAELTAALAGLAMNHADDGDLRRLAAVRDSRAAKAAAYFKANAGEWERIRALHAPEKDVETAIMRHIAEQPMDSLLDAGTGTGSMLELLAPHVKRAVGIDVSPEMLAIARDRLARADIRHAQVRLGNLYRLPFPAGNALSGFDAVLFHQVLHYLDDPQAAVLEASRVMRDGGHLLIADFASHTVEFLRDEYAHRRLGFSDREIHGWLDMADLKSVTSETIIPRGARGGKLIVKLWLARKTANEKAEAA